MQLWTFMLILLILNNYWQAIASILQCSTEVEFEYVTSVKDYSSTASACASSTALPNSIIVILDSRRMVEKALNYISSGTGNIWIGLTKHADGEFRWEGTEHNLTYTNWAVGEPSSVGNCVMANKDLGLAWKAAECRDKIPRLCMSQCSLVEYEETTTAEPITSSTESAISITDSMINNGSSNLEAQSTSPYSTFLLHSTSTETIHTTKLSIDTTAETVPISQSTVDTRESSSTSHNTETNASIITQLTLDVTESTIRGNTVISTALPEAVESIITSTQEETIPTVTVMSENTAIPNDATITSPTNVSVSEDDDSPHEITTEPYLHVSTRSRDPTDVITAAALTSPDKPNNTIEDTTTFIEVISSTNYENNTITSSIVSSTENSYSEPTSSYTSTILNVSEDNSSVSDPEVSTTLFGSQVASSTPVYTSSQQADETTYLTADKTMEPVDSPTSTSMATTSKSAEKLALDDIKIKTADGKPVSILEAIGEKRESNPGKSVVELRPSAVAIGSSAVIIIFTMIGLIVFLDMTSFYREIRRRIIFNLHNAKYVSLRRAARRYWFPCCFVTEEEITVFGLSKEQMKAFKLSKNEIIDEPCPLHLPRNIRKLSQLRFINTSTASIMSNPASCKLENIDETTSFDSALGDSSSPGSDHNRVHETEEKASSTLNGANSPQRIRRVHTMSTGGIQESNEDFPPRNRARLYTAPNLSKPTRSTDIRAQSVQNFITSKIREMSAKVSPTEEPQDSKSLHQNHDCDENQPKSNSCINKAPQRLDPKKNLLNNMKVDLDIKLKAIQAGLYDA